MKIVLDYEGIREDARKIGIVLMGAAIVAHFINENGESNWAVLAASIIVWAAGVIKVEAGENT